ncbi:MAG: alginate lyase family protein, partial [Balneolaceae bacterium]
QHYTYFNMKGLILQAEMRTRAGVNPSDTWTAGSESYSKRLKKGLDWLIPYAVGNKSLKDSQDFYKCRFIEFYRPAALALNEPRYEEVVETLIRQDRNSCVDILTLLTHPPLERPGQMTKK